MNCYDFDQTIFFPDSSYCFVMYCLRRFPRAVLSALPGTALSGCGKLLQLSDTRALKEQVFSFLPLLDDVDGIVEEFWDRLLIMMRGRIEAERERKAVEKSGENLEELFFKITEKDRHDDK